MLRQCSALTFIAGRPAPYRQPPRPILISFQRGRKILCVREPPVSALVAAKAPIRPPGVSEPMPPTENEIISKIAPILSGVSMATPRRHWLSRQFPFRNAAGRF
jgi:hypothetical protein